MIIDPQASEQMQHDRESRLFESLLVAGEDSVRISEIRRLFEESGLSLDDPRFHNVAHAIASLPPNAVLNEQSFFDLVRPTLLMFETAVSHQLVIPDFAAFKREIAVIFEKAAENHDGNVADYIPQLGRVDPEYFGLAITTIDGQRLALGDSNIPFCVQSVSKPFNYCFALEELGEDIVHQHMGCEPSGVSFNELSLSARGTPHNPMINAGGIMSSALIKQCDPVADRFDYVASMWTRLAGGQRPGFSNATYLSERATADRNFALGYSMRERRAFPEQSNLIENLEFYFQCCSLETTAETLSVVAATLANGGLCPLTGDQVLHQHTVQSCLSLMLSCGMYDYSGEWAFRIGLPAKSGVSGVVLTVVPGVMGICTWAPRLDLQGNSVRGIDFNRRLVEKFNFHVYDGLGKGATHKIDPRINVDAGARQLIVDMCWAASEGDCEGLRRLIIQGANADAPDYDGRTPMHLAASEGRREAVAYLLRLGARPDPIDRWGNTPAADAEREGHQQVAELLTAACSRSDRSDDA